MAEREKRTEITADRVVRELAKIDFSSMRNFIQVDNDGQPQLNLTNADDDNLDALAEVQTETIIQASGGGDEKQFQTIRKTKIKLHEKRAALHELARHTGVFANRDKG